MAIAWMGEREGDSVDPFNMLPMGIPERFWGRFVISMGLLWK